MFPNQVVRPSLFSRGLSLTKGINWSSFLDGTQKTLGVINQAIPIVYQVRPMLANARTMFKIADEIRTPTTTNNVVSGGKSTEKSSTDVTNLPVFYI